MGQLFDELKRRNVFRVAIAYTVVGWVIVQMIGIFVPLLGVPDWVGKAIFLLLLAGFPVALIFAWAFEMTPEGVKKTKDVDRDASVTAATGQKINYTIGAALALALGFIVWQNLAPGSDTTSGPVGETRAPSTSIAVLPFVNMSDDPANEYFSEGISEEILNMLAQIPDLHVTSRSSAFQFKGRNIHIPTVAKQLGVANVLEGSVRKSGTRVRITAQLIEASTDKHLWSASYDRELTDIFAVQDEISVAIVAALKKALGIELAEPTARSTTANVEAHEAYLRGRHLVVQRTRSTVEGAAREFGNAIALDPDYAVAHAELALTNMLLVRQQYGELTVAEAVARGRPHAARAMALAPTLAEAHAATGFIYWNQDNPDEALVHFKRAVAINPNYSIVFSWMGNLLTDRMGRYGEGLSVRETALRLDPLSIPAIGNRIFSLIDRGMMAQAEQELAKLASIAPAIHGNLRGQLTSTGGFWANAVLADLGAILLAPSDVWSRKFLTWEFASVGMGDEALAISAMPLPIVPAMLGRPADAVHVAEARLAEEPDSLFARRDMGIALAGVGDYARARPFLEEIWQQSGKRATNRGLMQHESAAALVIIRRANNELNTGELLAALKDNAERMREAGLIVHGLLDGADYQEGIGAFLSGERETGLALIAMAADEGFFILPNQAYLQDLYDDPGFAPIRAAQEARQTREREKVLAVICANNPYAAAWQPEPGTCDGANASNGE